MFQGFMGAISAQLGSMGPEAIATIQQAAQTAYSTATKVQEHTDAAEDKQEAVRLAAKLRDDAQFRLAVLQAVQEDETKYLLRKLVVSSAFRDEIYKRMQHDPGFQGRLEHYVSAQQT